MAPSNSVFSRSTARMRSRRAGARVEAVASSSVRAGNAAVSSSHRERPIRLAHRLDRRRGPPDARSIGLRGDRLTHRVERRHVHRQRERRVEVGRVDQVAVLQHPHQRVALEGGVGRARQRGDRHAGLRGGLGRCSRGCAGVPRMPQRAALPWAGRSRLFDSRAPPRAAPHGALRAGLRRAGGRARARSGRGCRCRRSRRRSARRRSARRPAHPSTEARSCPAMR